MRDEEQCLLLAVQIQEDAVQHDGGRVLVQSGCWFVKQQDRSLTGKCQCGEQAVSLSTGKMRSIFARRCFKPLRKMSD